MITMIITTVGLAGLFGFSLAVYVFLFRLNIAKPVKWVGAIGGGLVLGALMAAIALITVWPPFNSVFTVAGMALIIGTMALVISLPGGRKNEAAICSVASHNFRTKGDAHEGKEVLAMDFKPSTGTMQQ